MTQVFALIVQAKNGVLDILEVFFVIGFEGVY